MSETAETRKCEADRACDARADLVRIVLRGGCEIVGDLCHDHALITAELHEGS